MRELYADKVMWLARAVGLGRRELLGLQQPELERRLVGLGFQAGLAELLFGRAAAVTPQLQLGQKLAAYAAEADAESVVERRRRQRNGSADADADAELRLGLLAESSELARSLLRCALPLPVLRLEEACAALREGLDAEEHTDRPITGACADANFNAHIKFHAHMLTIEFPLPLAQADWP